MNEDKLICKSEKSNYYTLIICVGIALFSFFIYLIHVNYQPQIYYEEQTKFFGMLSLSLLVLFLIFHLLNQRTIYVYKDFFEIRRLLKKEKFYYSEFKTHYSEFFQGKYNSWTEYYLVLKNGRKITLTDTQYGNFLYFFVHIKNRIKIDKKYNKEITKHNYLKYAIICASISSLLFLSIVPVLAMNVNEKPSEIVFVKGTISDEFKYKSQRRSNGYYEFRIAEFPIFDFQVANNYELDKNNLLKNFSIGDIINVGIELDEYEKKIINTKELNFMDKYIRFSELHVKQIKDSNNLEYITNKQNENNSRSKTNKYLGIAMLSFFGLLFLYLAIGNYKTFKSENKTTKNN